MIITIDPKPVKRPSSLSIDFKYLKYAEVKKKKTKKKKKKKGTHLSKRRHRTNAPFNIYVMHIDNQHACHTRTLKD
jgi:hypothetical protein